jgi:hypothetical protein
VAIVQRIELKIALHVNIPAAIFAQSTVGRDFRASIATKLGLSPRNVIIKSVRDLATGIVIEYSLSDNMNRAEGGGRLLSTARMAMLTAGRRLQGGVGVEVTTEVITSNLDGSDPLPQSAVDNLSATIAAAGAGALLGDFIDTWGAGLGIDASQVETAAVVASTPLPAPGGETALPIGAIAGGAAAVVVIALVVAIVVVRRRRSAGRRISSVGAEQAATAAAAGGAPVETQAQAGAPTTIVVSAQAAAGVQEWGAPRPAVAAPTGGEPVMVQVVHMGKPGSGPVYVQGGTTMQIGSVAAVAAAPGQPQQGWATPVM